MLLSEKQVMEYVEYVLISVNKQTYVCVGVCCTPNYYQ